MYNLGARIHCSDFRWVSLETDADHHLSRFRRDRKGRRLEGTGSVNEFVRAEVILVTEWIRFSAGGAWV